MFARCFCGALRIELLDNPKWTGYCHCKSCQRATGAPVAAYAGYLKHNVQTIAGELVYFDSSPGVRWGSCKRCHSPVTYESSRWADEIHFHACTLDWIDEYRPHFHSNMSESVDWMDIADDLPEYDGAGPDN